MPGKKGHAFSTPRRNSLQHCVGAGGAPDTVWSSAKRPKDGPFRVNYLAAISPCEISRREAGCLNLIFADAGERSASRQLVAWQCLQLPRCAFDVNGGALPEAGSNPPAARRTNAKHDHSINRIGAAHVLCHPAQGVVLSPRGGSSGFQNRFPRR